MGCETGGAEVRLTGPLVAGLAAICAGCASAPTQHAAATQQADPGSHKRDTAPVPALMIRSGPVTLEMSAGVRARLGRAAPPTRRRLALQYLLQHANVQGGSWALHVDWLPPAADRLAAAVTTDDRSSSLPGRVSAVRLRLPTIHQAWRNDCETTALAMLLHGRVSQTRLQQELPVAKPYLPHQGATGTIWANPERGFIGDVAGGGYGVYDRPLLALARRYDPGAENLTGSSVTRLIADLAEGRPIVVWIQFGQSVPRTWTTPTGAVIHANFAEHTVTLTGWRQGMLTYNDPWTGGRGVFRIGTFIRLWKTLGDRAIAGSSMIGGGQAVARGA